MQENNYLPARLRKEEEQRECSSLDVILAQMVRAITGQFMDEVKDEIISIKKAEIHAEQEEASSNEYMTRKEVMKLLKRCDSTMTKWARRGYLVPLFIGGKYLYRKSDVMKLMK